MKYCVECEKCKEEITAKTSIITQNDDLLCFLLEELEENLVLTGGTSLFLFLLHSPVEVGNIGKDLLSCWGFWEYVSTRNDAVSIFQH